MGKLTETTERTTINRVVGALMLTAIVSLVLCGALAFVLVLTGRELSTSGTILVTALTNVTSGTVGGLLALLSRTSTAADAAHPLAPAMTDTPEGPAIRAEVTAPESDPLPVEAQNRPETAQSAPTVGLPAGALGTPYAPSRPVSGRAAAYPATEVSDRTL